MRKERKEDEERIIELQLKGMQKWARDKREIERRDGMWRSLTHCVILGWDPMTKWKESDIDRRGRESDLPQMTSATFSYFQSASP